MVRISIALIGVAALSIGGCAMPADIEEGQVPKICEHIDGTDRFVIDPNLSTTKAYVGWLGAVGWIEFVDQIAGYERRITTETQANYKCKAYTQ